MSPSEATPTAALQDLFNWSTDLPEWQRHRLRCLVLESLGDDEFADILELCRLEHGPPLGESTAVPQREKKGPPEPLPLAAQDIPRSEEVAAPVSLARIENVRYVNALAKEQTLAFAASGLTVIYGDNASGKSGSARILKRACIPAEPAFNRIEPAVGRPFTASRLLSGEGLEIEEQLFDRRHDPLEQRDLASAHPDELLRIRLEVAGWLERVASTQSEPAERRVLEESAIERLKTLGYVD